MLIWQRITCSILIDVPSFLVGWNWYKTLPTSLWCRLPIPTCTLIQKWYSPFPWHRRENKRQKFQSGILFSLSVFWNEQTLSEAIFLASISFKNRPKNVPVISALASKMAQMENKISSLHYYEKILGRWYDTGSLFFYFFDSLQRIGQKLGRKARVLFGGIESKKSCFWDFLTFNTLV